MTQGSSFLLTVLLLLPVLGAAVLLLMPGKAEGAHRTFAIVVGIVEFLLSLVLLGKAGQAGFVFVQNVPWVPTWGVSYHLGVDGISLYLVPLTTLVTAVAMIASGAIRTRVKAYMALLLILETAVVGTFISLDLFLFYFFWELMLVPVYLLIVGWGGPRRATAAMKFFIYSLVGSLLMLVGIVVLGYQGFLAFGAWNFDLVKLSQLHLGLGVQTWLFLAFGLAFAIKAPLFPFHSWLPDAYGESPAPVVAILSGVMSKAGIYGMLRFLLPLFPRASHDLSGLVLVLALAGLLYGAFVALIQKDMRLILGYSSLSHLGLIVLGIFTLNVIGLQGAIFQMVNHGVYVAGLFLLLGMIELRTGSRSVEALGGLAKRAPALAAVALFMVMAALGLPGLNGFAGEFMIFLGIFQSLPIFGWIGIAALVLASAYMIRFFQSALHGPAKPGLGEFTGRDMLPWEAFAVIPLALLVIFLGLNPGPIPRAAKLPATAISQRVPGPVAFQGPSPVALKGGVGR